ncbi:hypothetical protein F2Q69_00048839 [Brassica cretica]|uniref:Uncharacterized protein n=1 Tax=Brassica cretica TaxID=69181 RepID=A0A8S9Q1G0_BRACR|nr:hypothetical protein F2Q69_00048839 [Brassica cretica]
MHGFGSYSLIDVREDGLVGRYVATDSFADWSLRSDRLIRGSVATQRPTHSRVSRYVATDRVAWSVAT